MKRFLGFFILIAVAASIYFLEPFSPRLQPEATRKNPLSPAKHSAVTGLAGSEKVPFLSAPAVVKILNERYGLSVDVRKAGSVELVTGDIANLDFLWPGSQVNLEQFTARRLPYKQIETVFNSPIVLYTWAPVVDALVARTWVEESEGTWTMPGFSNLVSAIESRTPWRDLGLPSLYGNVSIVSTDPTRSNSGMMYAALLANTFNGGDVPTLVDVETIAPKIQAIFKRLGHMEHSSGVLFRMFISQGLGAYPIVVGYENQLMEFALENQQALPTIREQLKIVYPRPTLWSSHPFIALTDNGARLLEALKDPEVLQLAWREHGFRPATVGGAIDPGMAGFPGIPATIDSVMPSPNAAVVDHVLGILRGTP